MTRLPYMLALKISRLGPPMMENAFVVDGGTKLDRPYVVSFDTNRNAGCIALHDGCTIIELTGQMVERGK